MIPLPIDSYLDRIVGDVRRSRAAVVTAAPGAGKTTRVPPALIEDGPVILLQPRRVAARAIAARIAHERGWTLGREVGWQVRHDRGFSRETQLLVVTEGILTARLQSDPLLSGFRTIILDEFHERSIHADLAIALARQAWLARSPRAESRGSDLRIVVMSATLDSAAVSAFLDGCPVVDVPGRLHPIDISYAPGRSVAAATSDLLNRTDGSVLCFLPGAREIDRAIGELRPMVGDVDVLPLHGSLPAEDQDAALAPPSRRRVIVATNIAETSLTVPGVTAVVDSGLHKVARYDADRGVDSLATERITLDAADQRAGRAGRLAPGVVVRLWDARDRLRPHREPEIFRVDLASAALDVVAWGGDPRTLEWFERPRADDVEAALALLTRLGLVEWAGRVGEAGRAGGVRLTELGEKARHLPMHPRLGRVFLAGQGSSAIARVCEFLADRHRLPPRHASTSSDLLAVVDDGRVDEAEFRRAIFAGYLDRVAKRRERGKPGVLLSSGTGATLGRESGVVNAEFLIALDVSHQSPATSHQSPSALIRIASAIDREWLTPTSTETVHRFDEATGTVRAAVVDRYDALVLGEHPARPDPEIAARLLADAWLARGPRDADARLLRRLKFAACEIDLESTVRAAAYGVRSIDEIALTRALPPDVSRRLDRDAPESLLAPSGRHRTIEYNDDGTVSLSVKLQELFGLADTPRIGPRKEPVVLELLAPSGRPVQVTRDLRSFWNRTYPDVRKELRSRYPKHPWPENPWTATPSARTTRKLKREN